MPVADPITITFNGLAIEPNMTTQFITNINEGWNRLETFVGELNTKGQEIGQAVADAQQAAQDAQAASGFNPTNYYDKAALDAGALDGLYYSEAEMDALIAGINNSLTLKASKTNPSFTGSVTEQVHTLTGTTPDIDPANGTIQNWTLTAVSTPTHSITAGQYVTLSVTPSTYTFNLAGVSWHTDDGFAPALNATGKTVFYLFDMGDGLEGFKVGPDL
ncbi:MAG: hypothetical protein ACRBB6_03110 [Neptuniibacter sp.]